MATAEQRARRSAQRATAKAVRQARTSGKYTPRISRDIRAAARQGQLDYAQRVLEGKEPKPKEGTAEGNELARVASWASRNKANPQFEAAFSRYWYHHKKDKSEADIEDEADYEGDEEDEEELCS